MKQLSQEVISILHRASVSETFARDIISDPALALRHYDLTNRDSEYFKSFKSPEGLKQEYKEYLETSRLGTRGIYSDRIPDIYAAPASVYMVGLVAYILSSQYWSQGVTSFGLPLWATLAGSVKTFLGFYGFAAFVVLLNSLGRLFGRLGPTARVVALLATVILFFIPGSILLGILSINARLTLTRLLLTLIFTILPASLYSLFISTRGKTLWDEFVVNLARLDPVGYQQIIPIYRKKFSALYGSPDQSGFGSALLQGEASFPVLFATFLVGLGWILFFSGVELGQGADALVGGFVSPFTFGFLGAYLFSLSMLFRRYVQSDLKSVAYTHVSQRILLTWVWTFVLNVIPWIKFGISDEERLVFVSVLAFMVGIFPDIAWQVVTQFFQGILSIPLHSFREKYPLHKIDGITIWIEGRLLEEDVENVENLITTGIVDLMLRTNLKPERIVHWIDQGVLRLHLDQDQKSQESLQQALRQHGIITATDLLYAYKGYMATVGKTPASTPRVFLSEQLDPLVRDLVTTIKDDPNMYHVLAWRELSSTRISRLPQAVRDHIDTEFRPPALNEPVSTVLAVQLVPPSQ